MHFRLESDIAQPPSAVFAFLWDVDLHPGDQPVPEQPQEPAIVGGWSLAKRLRELVRLLPFVRADFRSEITCFEPPSALGYDFTWRTPVARMRGSLRYLFEPGPLGTHLTQDQTLEAEGPLRLLSPLMRGALRKRLERRMHALKAALERK